MEGLYPNVQRAAVVVGLLFSLAVVFWMERRRDWGRPLRRRLVMGLPLGSAVSLLFVLSVFLFLQDGLAHWFDPVTIPYSAWSYFYPLGVVTAAFAHDGSSHLVGNLTSALVVLPLAEYVFGHFPDGRGTTTFSSRWRNPWVRALVLFPAGVIVVGLLTALWSWGPVIGFSGVLFAAVGFALVRYPLATIVALAAQGIVVTFYRAMLKPVLSRSASEQFVTPGWAGIAVQGHALGLFIGATAAVALLWRRGTLRDHSPSPLRIWVGTVLLATSLGLWQLWWITGSQTFVLFRALGLLVVLGVGLLVTWAVTASDREFLGNVSRRQAAFVFLAVPLLVMALVAVPVNLNVVEDTPEDATGVEVRDYTVVYAEDVPNELYNVVSVELFGVSTDVTTSGVVVVSERRNIWSREVSPGQLAANGQAEVVVGGPGWRETVVAVRRGWSAVGGGTAYKVWLGPKDERKKLAYTSDPATADAVVAGYNVSVVADDGGFFLRLSRNNTTAARAPIPDDGASVTVRNVTFARDGRRVTASVGNTTVSVATRESY